MAHGESISSIHIWQTTAATNPAPPATAAPPTHPHGQRQPADTSQPGASDASQVQTGLHNSAEPSPVAARIAALQQLEQQQQAQQQQQQGQQPEQQQQQQQEQQQQQPAAEGRVHCDTEQVADSGVEEAECVYIVVGSRDRRLQWNPCKGRMLLLQLVHSEPGMICWFVEPCDACLSLGHWLTHAGCMTARKTGLG